MRFARYLKGKFAIMREGKVVDILDTLNDACKYARAAYADEKFSVHEIDAEPAQMGASSEHLLEARPPKGASELAASWRAAG